jgi:hypothetical protein
MHFTLPKREMEEFCRRWKVREIAVFGSALRQDFSTDSAPEKGRPHYQTCSDEKPELGYPSRNLENSAGCVPCFRGI